jgi:uncharacterized glyoxalase superfamily protein PhnB
MASLETLEIKAFVPSKDFELSKRFYQDLGFTLAWSSAELAYLHHGNTSFLLQNFYRQELADNFMMHLLVADVEAWWQQVQDQQLVEKYQVRSVPPQQQPWGMRDFVLIDPSGVLWRIGQNTDTESD